MEVRSGGLDFDTSSVFTLPVCLQAPERKKRKRTGNMWPLRQQRSITLFSLKFSFSFGKRNKF